MGYDRNERRFDRDEYRADRGYGRDYDREAYARGEDRGFIERAGDEVRSWFGDEEAERRRRADELYDERYDRSYGRDRFAPVGQGGYRRPDSYPAWARSNRDEGLRGRPSDPAYSGARYDRPSPGESFGGGYGRDAYGYGESDHGRTAYRGDHDDDYRIALRERQRREAERGSYSYGAGRDYGDGRTAGHDDDHHGYRNWRDQQVSALDRDYDEYRHENRQRFQTEFATWRTNRQTQRDSLTGVKEHQEVVGSDGVHIGTVDHVRSDHILLTKSDKDAHGHHHAIPSSWIATVADKVTLTKTADEAKRHWRDADERGGLFGGSGQSETDTNHLGRRNLDRSFNGTY